MTSASFFISYRRGDSAGHTGRLCDALEQRFGSEAVFQDIIDVAPGDDFVSDLERALTNCGAMLVVIGPTWATASSEGRLRLFDEDDLVRMEVAAALRRSDVLVIPVLVHGAVMPREAQLPNDLRLLATRQAIELTDSRWPYDVGRLADRLQQDLRLSLPGKQPDRSRRHALYALVVGVIVLLAAAGFATVILVRSNEPSSGVASTDVTDPAPNTPSATVTVDEELQTHGTNANTSETTSASAQPGAVLDTVSASAQPGAVLDVGGELLAGEFLRSSNERYILLMQSDGNLVIEDLTRPDDPPTWASNTSGDSEARAAMQPDGNMVIYRDETNKTAATPVYSTDTAGNPGATLILMDTGEFVIRSPSGTELFRSDGN